MENTKGNAPPDMNSLEAEAPQDDGYTERPAPKEDEVGLAVIALMAKQLVSLKRRAWRRKL